MGSLASERGLCRAAIVCATHDISEILFLIIQQEFGACFMLGTVLDI